MPTRHGVSLSLARSLAFIVTLGVLGAPLARASDCWKGDIDQNGMVNVFDVVRVVTSFASRPGEPAWDAAADVNGNGLVDVLDVIAVVTTFGQTCPLVVMPEGIWGLAGDQGGPFSDFAVTLQNRSSSAASWVFQGSAWWLSPSSTSGVVPARQSVQVTLSANPTASLLPAGYYWFLLPFEADGPEILASPVVLTVLDGAAAYPPFTRVTVDPAGPADMHCKAVGDLDGDGLPDLVVASSVVGGALVWYESPNWTRRIVSALGGWSTDAEVADLDRDGDQDIVISALYRSGDNGIEWFENLGGGSTWSRHVIGPPAAHDIELADLDLDGDLDIVTRHQGDSGAVLELWRQDPGLTWTHRTLTGLPSGEGVALADVDRDTDVNVLIAGLWLENPGDFINGAWAMHTYTTAWSVAAAKVAGTDINRDGRINIVLAPAESAGDPPAEVAWFEAPADPTAGNWAKHVIDALTERVLHSLVLVDIDNDFDLDVVTAEMHQSTDPDEVRIYLNAGLGSNGSIWQTYTIGQDGSHDLRAADLDGDGDIDLFGTNWSGDAPTGNRVDVWINGMYSTP